MAERGRPSIFTEELATRICERLAAGESLVTVSADAEMPHRATVHRWRAENSEFRDRYARAREDQADSLAEEALERGRSCGQDEANAARVHIDTIKWYAAKVAPKTYGDKQTHEVGGIGGGPLVITWQPPSE
jgi:acyl-CoA reductase-like NAD-dependent aldehyde dehydrogenase